MFKHLSQGKSPKGGYRLLVVAHPDDETIYFGGLLQRLKDKPWLVVLATDGNADGGGKKRLKDFQKALKRLKVKSCVRLNLPDRYKMRLDVKYISNALLDLPRPFEVYTHGILGEYGHPHHQDVCMATHMAFERKTPIYQVAHNAFPEKSIHLNQKEYKKKSEILVDIYGSETQRFLMLLPCQHSEGFLKVSLGETQAIYKFWTKKKLPKPSELKKFKWIHSYLKKRKSFNEIRLF